MVTAAADSPAAAAALAGGQARQGKVLFPLVGDRERGLGGVRVIDWGQSGLGSRMTQTGPTAHRLGKADEIEATIRSARLCSSCRSAAPDSVLMVELVLEAGQQITGTSYTLALALADLLARDCLPRLAGRTLVASGHVRADGAIAAVGRLAEKLEAIEQALQREQIPAPLLVLPQANLEQLGDTEQRLLDALTAVGTQVRGIAGLAALGPEWPALGSRRRPSGRAAGARRTWLAAAAALAAIAVLGGVALGRWTDHGCAAAASDPRTLERCTTPLPLELAAECRFAQRGGYRPWRGCADHSCLAERDQFRLLLRPGADGWLHVFHLERSDRTLEVLWPDRTPRRVRSGETIRLPETGRAYQLDGRADQEAFFALLLRDPLPDAFSGEADAQLMQLLDARAVGLRICRAQATPEQR